MADLRMMYGVTIHDSIQRGNLQEMQQLLAQARAVYQEQGDLGQAIAELEGAIKRGGGGVIRPLYGVTIYDAIKRGNQDELQQLLLDARATMQEQGDIANAVSSLEAAIKGGGVGGPMPYGVAINDAIRRNDRAAMQTLLDQTKDTKDPGIADAVKELQSALQKKG
jgi:hypothetical protein